MALTVDTWSWSSSTSWPGLCHGSSFAGGSGLEFHVLGVRWIAQNCWNTQICQVASWRHCKKTVSLNSRCALSKSAKVAGGSHPKIPKGLRCEIRFLEQHTALLYESREFGDGL